jgi:hypothetical protein
VGFRTAVFKFIGIFLLAGHSVASEYEEYVRALKILQENHPRAVVSSVASGFGASTGEIYAAASYSNRDLQTEGEGDDDGSIVLGVGLGSPDDTLAYEIALGVTSVSTAWWGDGKFADEGNLNLKVHKTVAPVLTGTAASVAVGASNITGWGGTLEIPTNYYTVYSEKFTFGKFDHYGAAISFGYGTSVSDGETAGDYFGGLGVARSNYNGSLSFIGNEAHVSATWYVPKLSGLAITFTRADVWNQEHARRNILSVGYAFKLGADRI